MLAYNEIRTRAIIIYNDEPCQVVDYHVARTQQRKPQNQVKLKSLITGKTFGATFHTSESAEEADIERREVKFLYHKPGKGLGQTDEYWFCNPKDPSDRFQLSEDVLGESKKFLKENTAVSTLIWLQDEKEEVLGIELPVKMEFKVHQAPPAVKGNTAQGGKKDVVLENGTTITTPMFIESGDVIRVNTETGEYVERVS